MVNPYLYIYVSYLYMYIAVLLGTYCLEIRQAINMIDIHIELDF